MDTRTGTWRRRWRPIGWGLALPLLAPVLVSAAEPEVVALGPETPVVAPAAAKPSTLAEFIQIAMDRQPALAAARASLAVAEGSLRDLERHRLAALVSREVPVRKKQAELGVVIATAGLNQAEWETIYAVTRNYFTVLYAREQRKLAEGVIDRLKATRDAAKGFMENPVGKVKVTQESIDQISTYLLLAQTRKIQAQRGEDRALAALREAMGVEPCFSLEIGPADFPSPGGKLCRGQVIDLALARRGEMAQAVNVARVTELEIEAQGTSCLFSMRTFASLADVHARPIPQGEWNSNYRPGALGVEMPPTLAGTKSDRMNRARELTVRAEVVVQKTRNLIALEAENMFLQWQAAAGQINLARDAAAKANKLELKYRQDFTGGQNVTVKEVLDSLILLIQAGFNYNETRYKLALTLAGLQRVTAGGYSPRLDRRSEPIKDGG
jgi:outer membrane protein TolC